MLSNAREHFGADFIAVVEGEDEIWPARAAQSAVRTRLPFELPPDTQHAESTRRALVDGHCVTQPRLK